MGSGQANGAVRTGVDSALASAAPMEGVMYVIHGAEAASGAAAGGLGRSRWCGLRGESHGGFCAGGFCAGGFCAGGFCEAGRGEAGCGEGGCGEGGRGEAGGCEGDSGESGLRKCPTVTLLPRGRRAPPRGCAPSSDARVRGAALWGRTCTRLPEAGLPPRLPDGGCGGRTLPKP